MNLENLSIRDIEARIAAAFNDCGIARATLTKLSAADLPGDWRLELTLHGSHPSFCEPYGGKDIER